MSIMLILSVDGLQMHCLPDETMKMSTTMNIGISIQNTAADVPYSYGEVHNEKQSTETEANQETLAQIW